MKNYFLTATIIISLFIDVIYAQKPGDLDSTFGINGIITLKTDSTNSEAYSIAIQTDCKIIVAGGSYVLPKGDFLLVRYNTDGTLDNSFGLNGIVTTNIDTYWDYVYDIAIQNDGKILAVGYSSHEEGVPNFCIARYNTDGTLDNSFGKKGILIIDFGENGNIANSLAIQKDGKIVVAGQSNILPSPINIRRFSLVRCDTNGVLDKNFGVDGKQITEIYDGANYVSSLAIQSDGKILVAGSSKDTLKNTGDNFALVRYNPNGLLDKTFGINGIIITPISKTHYDNASSIVIQSDGKILLAGQSGYGKNGDFALVRYNQDGTLDNKFGLKGKITTKIGNEDDIIMSLFIQPDGKIITAGGSKNNGKEKYFALARYNSDGSLDKTFSEDGKQTTLIGNDKTGARGVAIQNDGKIIAVGYASDSQYTVIALARYFSLFSASINFTVSDNFELNYSDSIKKNNTIEYELQKEDIVSIQLIDSKSNIIKTYTSNVKQELGKHSQVVTLPDNLISGSYSIVISSGNGKVKLIKVN